MTNLLTLCLGPVGRKASCSSPADSWATLGQDGNIFSLPASLTSYGPSENEKESWSISETMKGMPQARQDCGEVRLALRSHTAPALPAQLSPVTLGKQQECLIGKSCSFICFYLLVLFAGHHFCVHECLCQLLVRP